MIQDNNKSKLILVLVIILAIAIIFLGYAISVTNNGNSNVSIDTPSSNEVAIDYSLPTEPTAEAKIDTSKVNSQLLGSNELGSVELIGPFGNPNSKNKITYSIGMHPWESKVHKALFDTLVSKNSSLKYCYYVYLINVSNYNT